MGEPIIKKSEVRHVTFGENVTVIEPANLYECKLGDYCFIGPFVEIRNNCKIQSHSFICELVTIGNNCFIGHGVVFINDLFTEGSPAGGDRSKWKRTRIGNNVSIGSNATILPVEICDGAVIGAGSVVTKDILVEGKYAGNPARKIER